MIRRALAHHLHMLAERIHPVEASVTETVHDGIRHVELHSGGCVCAVNIPCTPTQ